MCTLCASLSHSGQVRYDNNAYYSTVRLRRDTHTGIWRRNLKKTAWRLSFRWENNIKMDTKGTGWRIVCGLAFYLTQDRNEWWCLAYIAMDHRFSKNLGFTSIWRTFSLSRGILLRGASEFVSYTGKHGFCHMKTNLCFLCILPRWIQTCYLNCFITHGLVWQIFKMQF